MAEDLLQDPEALKHRTAYDRDGKPIGVVAEVYLDYRSRLPEWITLHSDPEGTEHTFVPLQDAFAAADGGLRVAYARDTVSAAPRINADQHLALDQEQELYAYYGLTLPATEESAAPGVGDTRPPLPLTGAAGEVSGVAELSPGPAPQLVSGEPGDLPRLRLYAPEAGGATVAPDGPGEKG
ncbi:PRC-barrel domain-containing protein [Streptomyces sp. NBC_01476]|uniref:PRC-barrel domain-containing protein n=1 Tax=Streptomyces sp. NBC_01476 TaxID=2903881 RepID=UPI002E37D1FF|nr:PRC-barrel domain-containing protein [Streptomyces sp. NBC_01476]